MVEKLCCCWNLAAASRPVAVGMKFGLLPHPSRRPLISDESRRGYRSADDSGFVLIDVEKELQFLACPDVLR